MSDFGVFLLMGAGILLLLGLIRFFAWLTEVQEEHGSLPRAAASSIKKYVAVSHYQDSVMSRDQDEPPYSAPRLETDARQTPDRPAPAKRKAEEFFTLCQVMRAAGIKREDAAAAFKASDLPFNNNVWARAEPPEPAQVTPIAGRPTDADFPYEVLK